MLKSEIAACFNWLAREFGSIGFKRRIYQQGLGIILAVVGTLLHAARAATVEEEPELGEQALLAATSSSISKELDCPSTELWSGN